MYDWTIEEYEMDDLTRAVRKARIKIQSFGSVWTGRWQTIGLVMGGFEAAFIPFSSIYSATGIETVERRWEARIECEYFHPLFMQEKRPLREELEVLIQQLAVLPTKLEYDFKRFDFTKQFKPKQKYGKQPQIRTANPQPRGSQRRLPPPRHSCRKGGRVQRSGQ